MSMHGADWEKRSLKLHDLGLAIAPELFTIERTTHLGSGKTLYRGTRYFPWDTARDLVRYRRVPQGWRLPTVKEAEAIKNVCNGASQLDGFVYSGDMEEYSRHPEISDGLIVGRGKIGYCWTSEIAAPSYPYAIFSSELTKSGKVSIHFSHGLPIILVRKIR